MGAIENEKIYALKIRESANDGSDFGTPDADYRFAFVGEDGKWHLKDASDVVTDLGGDADTHIADATDAHDASAISVADSGGLLTATDVEAALAEIAGDSDNHIADSSGAHAASAISVLDTAANFTGTDVEAVLAELQDNIDAGGIPVSTIDAAGDLLIGTADDTVGRLALGTAGQVLTVNAGATAPEWAAPAGGGGGAAIPEPWFILPASGLNLAQKNSVGMSNLGLIVPCMVLTEVEMTGVRLWIGTQSGNISVAVYDEDYDRLATSGSVACPATGWRTVSFSAAATLPAGRYWLGLSASTTGSEFGMATLGTLVDAMEARAMSTAHPLPNPFVPSGAGRQPVLVGIITGGWAP